MSDDFIDWVRCYFFIDYRLNLDEFYCVVKDGVCVNNIKTFVSRLSSLDPYHPSTVSRDDMGVSG